MLKTGELVKGRYRILYKVGQGGMSVVYLARDEWKNMQWAVKEVRREGIQDSWIVEQGLVTETNMLKRLNHPNLPHIADVIENKERFLIVMDYIPGISMKEQLEEKGAFSQEDVIRWGMQLCDVLGYLHMQEPPIIYRDLKPANIMLKPDGDIKLIDFGTAREYKAGNEEDTINIGTVGYAAPEQYGGMGQSDARTDIYCLGVTLYQMLTGKNPCEPPYLIVPVRQENPELSKELEELILKCTRANPSDRYQSCKEVFRALERCLGEEDQAEERNRPRKQRFFERLLSGSLIRRWKVQEERIPDRYEKPGQEEPLPDRYEEPGQEEWMPDRYGEPRQEKQAFFEDDPDDGSGGEVTELLLPKEPDKKGRFVIIKDIVEIHTDEVI